MSRVVFSQNATPHTKFCFMPYPICVLAKKIKKKINYSGPSWIPLLGVIPLVKNLHNICGFYHLVWHYLAQRYGPIVGLRCGHDRLIIVAGKNEIKEFYANDKFNGRPDGFFYRIRSFDKRLGVVFTDGKAWEVQRRFSLKVLRQLGGKNSMKDHIEREANEIIHFLYKKAKTGLPINMQHIFDVPVLNILWALLAGHRLVVVSGEIKKNIIFFNSISH